MTPSLGLEPAPIRAYLREVPQGSGFAHVANCQRQLPLGEALGERREGGVGGGVEGQRGPGALWPRAAH